MNINKTILAAAAVAIASTLVISTSAFKRTSEEKKLDDKYSFTYNSPGGLHPYSKSNVQNKANWQYITGDSRCDDDDELACRIYVSSSNVVPNGGGFDLASTFSITASNDADSTTYVVATSDGSDADYISNRSE